MECQWDWQTRYLPYLRGIKGFTNTSRDPDYVRTFRFTRTEDGLSEMHFKGSPSCPEWFGANSVPNTPGFPILCGIPDGMPQYKDPTGYRIPDAYIKHLANPNFVKYAKDNNREPMHAYLMEMARTLTVPSLGIASESHLVGMSAIRRSKILG